MPKNKVLDPITDQEVAFVRLVLSGALTDRRAAEAVGINPDSAAYIKSKPRVGPYMLEHHTAVQQQLIQQEAEGLHRLNLDREQVLARLWQIANLSPEMTRGSITGQFKALAMIVAMQSFIPDRLAVLAEKNPPAAPTRPQVYVSAWRAGQQAATTAPQPGSVPARQEDSPAVPEPELLPGWEEAPPQPDPSHSTSATHVSPPQPQPPAPYAPIVASVPDARTHFSLSKNPFARQRCAANPRKDEKISNFTNG